MGDKVSSFIDCRGIKIHCLTENIHSRERPSILFVPGVMMPAWIWDKQLDYFSKNYRVVAMDPRSQGESEQCSEGHYALSLAEDIKGIVETLDLEPFVLVGWSLAVPEVVNYAVRLSSRGLRGLVLVDGLVGIDPSVPFYQSTVDYWAQLQVDRIPKTEEFVRAIFKRTPSEVYLQKLLKSALRTPTNTVMTLINNYLLQDFRPLLPQIHVPTLIATVEGPRLEYMQNVQNMIPQSQLHIFQEAGHTLFVDQPEEFNIVLERFIKNVCEHCIRMINHKF